MSVKAVPFPGFTALSDQVFVREASPQDTPKPDNHPSTIVIYSWGDGIPKHLLKYCDGFAALYPNARQFAILSPISKAMFTNLQQRSDAMLPLVNAIFPNGPENDKQKESILLHAMSNTGAINYASTLHKYEQLYNQPLPHKLMVLDSTPGSTDMSVDTLQRWSRAMALGTAGWFPWPFVVTQSIWAFALLVNHGFQQISGREHAGAWSKVAVNDEKYETKDSQRLYVYSKEDDLIGWQDVEIHVAQARKLGWEVDTEMFEGSNHVGHMRMHPEKYWKAMQEAWERASKA